MVDRGPICTKRLFGAAMKMIDKIMFLVLRFLKATPFVLFSIFFMVWLVLLCFRTRYASSLLALYTLINCDCLVYSASQSDHIIIICISLGCIISTDTGVMMLGRDRPPSKTPNARTKVFNLEIRYRNATTQQSVVRCAQ